MCDRVQYTTIGKQLGQEYIHRIMDLQCSELSRELIYHANVMFSKLHVWTDAVYFLLHRLQAVNIYYSATFDDMVVIFLKAGTHC